MLKDKIKHVCMAQVSSTIKHDAIYNYSGKDWTVENPAWDWVQASQFINHVGAGTKPQFLREPLHKMVISDKQMVIETIAIFIVCDVSLTFGSPLNSEILDINSEPGKPYIMQAMGEFVLNIILIISHSKI